MHYSYTQMKKSRAVVRALHDKYKFEYLIASLWKANILKKFLLLNSWSFLQY